MQQPFTAYRAADVPVVLAVAKATCRSRTNNLLLTGQMLYLLS